MTMKNLNILIATGVLFLGCKKTEFSPVERTKGTADFTNYVAVGNSLTQGFMDGGLYEEGQKNSYPSLVARQMALAQPTIGEFKQPMTVGNGSGYMHLEIASNGELDVINSTDPTGYPEDASWSSWGTQYKSTKMNNLGVSGIELIQTSSQNNTDAVANNVILGGINFQPLFSQPGNPFARFMDFGGNPLLGGTPIQYLDHVKQSGATFFTCWLGNNDVLGYALAGGVSTTISIPTLGTYEYNKLSDVTEFSNKYDSVLTVFQNLGAEGVCGTLPDVTSIPNLTTITIASVKADFYYDTVYIEDYNGNVRPGTDADLILLSASDTVKGGAGSSASLPIPNGLVLDEIEKQQCQQRTIALNNEIVRLANEKGFGVVDMYQFLKTLGPGFTLEGIEMSVKYIEGGTFSLDGIHPNPRGYAVVANKWIEAINDNYGSNLPLVDIGAYRGVVIP